MKKIIIVMSMLSAFAFAESVTTCVPGPNGETICTTMDF